MKNSTTFFNQVILMFTLGILSIGFQSCNEKPKEKQQTENSFDLTAAKAEIIEANKKLMSLVAAGDSIGIANMYTTDAKLMFAGRPADVGRAAIQTTLSNIIRSGVSRINLKTIDVFGTETLLAEEGEVTVFVGDNPVAVEKYIILWKKEEDKWKLFRDIANSNSK